MIRYLISRPIGTCVVTLTLVALGIIATFYLPVSLLPDVPVPEITIQASYPSADAGQIQQIIATPIRNQMLQLNKLEDLDAISTDGQVTIKLRFDYRADMNLAYLEAHEKIDMLMETFPRNMIRPRVIKASAGDIPIFQLNVAYQDNGGDFLQLSNFCENILKRRLEQLPEIALVDITGLAKAQVVIKPDKLLLQSGVISLNTLAALIENQAGDQGSIVIKDGPYEYGISFEATLRRIADIENLYVKVGGDNPRLIRLGDISETYVKEQEQGGLYVFNKRRAIAMAIVKQSDAQLLLLKPKISTLIENLKVEYPNLIFTISQDQTRLLELSISNLLNSLIAGAILSFVMILFFMKDKRNTLLIALTIPVSLSVTLLGFYILGISINVVSLAGLLLGIGEIIDSSIIIIESIQERLQQDGTDECSLIDACVGGTQEVANPLLTAVLTNSVVYLPLLFLSGIAGALFYDQAIAVTLALGVSLITSYTLIPVIYFQIFKNVDTRISKPTKALRISENVYNTIFRVTFKKTAWVTLFWLVLISGGIWCAQSIDKKGMPNITRTELEVYIHWNEQITTKESTERLKSTLEDLPVDSRMEGVYIGQQQFIFNSRLQQSRSEARIVFQVNSVDSYNSLSSAIEQYFQDKYPQAAIETRPAMNVFEQLFQTQEPPLRIQLYGTNNNVPPSMEVIDRTCSLLRENNISLSRPPRRQKIRLHLLNSTLLLYDVDRDEIIRVLKANLQDANVGLLHSEQQQIPIMLGSEINFSGLSELLDQTFVANRQGSMIPVKNLIRDTRVLDFSSYHMSKDGIYISLTPNVDNTDIEAITHTVKNLMSSNTELTAQFAGSYYRNLSYIEDLQKIVAVALLILFFILAAQFESLVQPLLVLMTILFGLSGAILMLYLSGNSINIMSIIGMVVLIGLLDNDSILKIDLMNRNRDRYSLIETIRLGGKARLQSQLMTVLTTVLGLLPVLWSTGLGAELQKPLALAVIGGMLSGILISWTFIPLTYFLLYKISSSRKLNG
jgi:multidrug efflux pump subunit AcrB